jgi:ABC-type uncharacterized transport system permease subunit
LLVICAAALSLGSSEYTSAVGYVGVAIGLFANIAPSRVAVVATIFANLEINKSGIYGSWNMRAIVEADNSQLLGTGTSLQE